MADNNGKKSVLFGLGLALGAVIGGVAAFFFAPEGGKEHRNMVAKKIKELEKKLKDAELDKKVKEIYGEVSEQATATFLKVKKEVIKRVAEAEVKLKRIDKEKYMEILGEVVSEVKRDSKHTEKILEKLKAQLETDWKKIQK